MSDDFSISNITGVGPVTIKKLKDAGITSLHELVIHGPVDVEEITGMTKDASEKVVSGARKKLANAGEIQKDFTSGLDIYELRKKIDRITTSTHALDDLFGGGVETKSITEVYGEFGSGKTQFCHTMCVTVQKPKDEGGLDAGVLYIDTEGTFRPERIVTIAKAHDMDPEKVLNKIMVARAYNSSHQLIILEQSGKVIQDNNIKLVISDSMAGLFRAEYLGRGTLATRQQRIGKHVRMLARMAEIYNCAVIGTNQVSADPSALFGDPTRPIGGHVLGHASTYRLYFRKGSKNKRVVKFVDSPSHPQTDVPIELSDRGIQDVADYVKIKEKQEKQIEKDKQERQKEIEKNTPKTNPTETS